MKAATTLLLSAALGTTMGFAPATQTSPPTLNTPASSSTSLAFFGTAGKKSPVKKSSPLVDEAVEIYTSKFNGSAGRGKFFWESWGMPSSYQAPEDSSKLIFARNKADLVSTFNVIASLYGEDAALMMVKIQPGVLAFNKDNFRPSLEAFSTKFGAEEAREMVIRNPGLLSVKPANAEAADDLTMQLSYVVKVTRPIGALGPFVILGLLSVPAIESATGLSRGDLFASVLH